VGAAQLAAGSNHPRGVARGAHTRCAAVGTGAGGEGTAGRRAVRAPGALGVGCPGAASARRRLGAGVHAEDKGASEAPAAGLSRLRMTHRVGEGIPRVGEGGSGRGAVRARGAAGHRSVGGGQSWGLLGHAGARSDTRVRPHWAAQQTQGCPALISGAPPGRHRPPRALSRPAGGGACPAPVQGGRPAAGRGARGGLPGPLGGAGAARGAGQWRGRHPPRRGGWAPRG
jgi:hypothetical protein